MPDVTPAATRWLRLLAVLLGVLLAGAATAAARVAIAGRSPGALAAAVAGSIAALGCLVVAIVPAQRHQPLWSGWERVHEKLRQSPASVGLTAGLFLALGCAGYALIVLRLLSIPQNPWDDDQGAFLQTAQEIHDRGGIDWLWSALWSGEFAEANRHPLYLALLSLSPIVRDGQWLSAALGASILVTLTYLVRRRLGALTAAIFGLLLATNGAFCLFSSRVVCDILMVGLCGLAWLIHTPAAGNPSNPLSPVRCLAGGALLGLAWLTKGTGLPLFAGYLLWLLLAAVWPAGRNVDGIDHPSPQSLRSRALGPVCAIIAFLAISLPLIVRNSVRFGSPFHNVNSLLLFADRYEEFDEMVSRGLTTGEAAREYLAEHSLGDLLRREASGLVWEAYIVLRSLGPAPLDDSRVIFGLPWALLAAARMASRRSAADGLILIWALLSWLLFAWYVPIAAGERFILPLLAPLLVLASEALARIVTSPQGTVRRSAAAGMIAWPIVWVALCWLSTGLAERTG